MVIQGSSRQFLRSSMTAWAYERTYASTDGQTLLQRFEVESEKSTATEIVLLRETFAALVQEEIDTNHRGINNSQLGRKNKGDPITFLRVTFWKDSAFETGDW